VNEGIQAIIQSSKFKIQNSEARSQEPEAGSQEPNIPASLPPLSPSPPPPNSPTPLLPKTHRPFTDALEDLALFQRVDLSELAEETPGSLNLASRPVPAIPHQFGKLAETIRGERDRKFAVWLISAQPSRSVALLQEHDCPAQFIPNPGTINAIDKLQTQHMCPWR
jgi:transcription-repair coupling factor (superfamily II helicase)